MGDEQRVPHRPASPRRTRALRRGHRLHGGRRGGVRAARPRLARPRQPLRRRAGGRCRNATERYLAGELIASEVEIKTGRVETLRRGAAARSPSAGRSSLRLVEPLGLALGATGAHPWANWKDQRIIDTPHYRRNDELLRYVVWKNNTFGFHVHVGIRGADRAIQVTTRAPQLAARAARPVGELAVRRGGRHRPPLGANADLHALLPALRRPRRVPLVGRLRALRPVPLRHGLDHRAHPALVERSAASRVPDRRDPHLRRPARSRRVAVARGALRRADGPHRARHRRGRADRRPAAPPDRGEHVARDPLRALGRADRPRARRRAARPRAPRAADRVGAAGRGARSAPRSGCGCRSRTRPSARSRVSPRSATWPRSTATSSCVRSRVA